MKSEIQVILRTISTDGRPADTQQIVGKLFLDAGIQGLQINNNNGDEFHIQVLPIDEIKVNKPLSPMELKTKRDY